MKGLDIRFISMTIAVQVATSKSTYQHKLRGPLNHMIIQQFVIESFYCELLYIILHRYILQYYAKIIFRTKNNFID